MTYPDSADLTEFVNNATTGPVLLVGHSYGGAVITDSSPNDPTVRGLVYVDAFAPAEGDTLGGILAAFRSPLLQFGQFGGLQSVFAMQNAVLGGAGTLIGPGVGSGFQQDALGQQVFSFLTAVAAKVFLQ